MDKCTSSSSSILIDSDPLGKFIFIWNYFYWSWKALPSCLSALIYVNAMPFNSAELNREQNWAPNAQSRKRETYNSSVNMTFPVLRHTNMVLTIILGKKEPEENIFKFMFLWCLRQLCEKVIYLPLDINSGWIMNQFYQTLDTGFWYTVFLQLSSMKFSGKKKKKNLDYFVGLIWSPCCRVFLFRKKIFSQVSKQMQWSNIF